MKRIFFLLVFVAGLSCYAQTSSFTYQGRLNDGNAAATGNYDLQFVLRDAASAGNPVGSALTNSPVAVSNGLFTTTLDFGATAFNGNARWLEIGVRTNGSASAFTILSPRQQVTSAPYAIQAANAGTVSGAIADSQLSGNIPRLSGGAAFIGTVTAGSFTGNGASLTALNASQLTSGTVPAAALGNSWQIGGNNSTTPGVNFVGTTDNQALEFKVNGSRALRLEPNATSPNVIGGYSGNYVAAGVAGATISGGGLNASANSIFADYATIGGGGANTIQTNAAFSTIGGGRTNTIQTNAYYSTIGGGYQNTIQTNAAFSTIGGGAFNTIQANANNSTIGGGGLNTIQTNADYSTIGGGGQNTIQTNAIYSTIGGGFLNTIQTNSQFAVIPGGRLNIATNYAFAAGYNAQATNTGAFVWSDGSGTATGSGTANSVTMRASGGFSFITGTGSAGAALLANSTSWSVLSDRNAKKNFRPVDQKDVLEKLAALPVQSWNYKWEPDTDVPHIGPVAQDFKAVFYPGRDDKSISTLEFDGIELAAIQGLNQKVEVQKAELTAKQQQIELLENRLSQVERLINSLVERK